MASNDELFIVSVQSTCYDSLIKILFRVVTFPLNGLALRYISKEVLGLINVRLALLHAMILFISRECFRNACKSNNKEYNWSHVVNLTWLMVPVVAIVSYAFCLIWLGHWNLFELPQEQYRQDYELAVKLFGVSCVIESLVEPVYIFSQSFFYLGLKLFVDFLMTLIRACILAATVLCFPECTIRATAYGQLAISTVFVVVYWIYFHLEFRRKARFLKNRELHRNHPLAQLPFSSITEFLPQNVFTCQTFLDGKLARLTLTFFIQGVFHQILTDGERFVMTGFSALTIAEQGTYDAVNNLGSLAARLVFRPIEDNSNSYFAKKLSRDKSLKEHSPNDIKQLSDALSKYLRAVALIGLGVLSFGFSYSHLLLLIYGGSTLVDGHGPLLMKTNCLAASLMAINGVTEAYAKAAMNSKRLSRYSILTMLLSCNFLFLSWSLSYMLGSIGFIIANCCNMGLRILHSLWFIHRHFQDVPAKPLLSFLPSKRALLALAFALVATLCSEVFIYPYSVNQHLAFGVLVGMIVLRVIVYDEVGGWNQLYCLLKQQFSQVRNR